MYICISVRDKNELLFNINSLTLTKVKFCTAQLALREYNYLPIIRQCRTVHYSAAAEYTSALFRTVQSTLLLYSGQGRVQFCSIQDSADYNPALSWTVQSTILLYPGQCRVQSCSILACAEYNPALSWTVQSTILLYPGPCRVQFCSIQDSAEYDPANI